MREAFSSLGLAPPERTPYDFQIQAAETIWANRATILVAPTGSGKTETALAPFIAARRSGQVWADRLIYCLPQRTLASGLHGRLAPQLAPLGLCVTLQMGAEHGDPDYTGDVILTTIDQALSAFVGRSFSVARRRANIRPGALLGAYLVFDEFHLLECERALATVCELGRRWNDWTRLLLMTATMPPAVVDEVARRTGAVTVAPSPAEVQAIPIQQRRRFLTYNPEPLTAGAVLSRHRGRTLVVTNTVARAQELYLELRDQVPTRLLHSRFLPGDRQNLERDLMAEFGRDGGGQGVVVATQVVEVGLDVSFADLCTEVAPANALVQRAGRCARFAETEGRVHVFALPTTESGQPRYGPYRNGRDRTAIDRTAALLAAWPAGQHFDYAAESQLVAEVHAEADGAGLMAVDPEVRRRQVSDTMAAVANDLSELIRDISSVDVIIHDQPEQLELRQDVDRFSLPYVSLLPLLRDLAATGTLAETCQVASVQEESEGPGIRFVWKPAQSPQQALAAAMVALSPAVARYEPDLGLRLGDTGAWHSATHPRPNPNLGPFTYQRETYAQHVERVCTALGTLLAQHQAGCAELAATAGMTPEALAWLVQVTAAVHDAGKLSTRWQDAAWAWQTRRHGTPRSGFLAHTDFDPRRDEEALARGGFPPRGSHSVEGTLITLKLLESATAAAGPPPSARPGVLEALRAAVARHHGPATARFQAYQLCPGADAEIRRPIPAPPGGQQMEWPPPTPAAAPERLVQLERLFPKPNQEFAVALYLWAVRLVRLADGAAVAAGKGGGK